MRSKIIIITLFVAAISLAVLHDLALRLNWYYFYPSIDIPLHILGGFVVGLFTYVFAMVSAQSEVHQLAPFRLLFVVILATLFVGLIWETMELVFYLTKDAGLSLETLSDVIFGIVGSVLAWSLTWLLPTNKKADSVKSRTNFPG